MDGATRRRFLGACGVTAAGLLAGCNGRDDPASPASSSPTPVSEPEGLLPQAGDGWTRDTVESNGFAWSTRGGVGGVFGYYTSPGDRAYRVVVMEMRTGSDPEREANSWACSAGWTVALGYRRFAVAASTGTTQRTFTPEAPPQMTRTPIPGTTEPAMELLSNSPGLSWEYVDEHAITGADC